MGKAPAACAEAFLGEEVVGGRLGWGLSRQNCWLATREALVVTGAVTHGSHRFGVSRVHGVCACVSRMRLSACCHDMGARHWAP